MCKCLAGSVVCCCCQCAMSVFISLLFFFLLVLIGVAVAVYFGFFNVDDTAPELAKFINQTRDKINNKLN
uniref:Putative midgut expression 1 n=1 Tax=Corethrella appendiculata TaxID=1370023 RepID=U5EFR5_9DIPT